MAAIRSLVRSLVPRAAGGLAAALAVALAAPPRAASAVELDDLFPPAPLSSADAEALLSAERIGEPATVFDARTVTRDPADDWARAVEREALGKDADRLEAPDSLRRYAGLMTPLVRRGDPMDIHRVFVADHVGLPDVPFLAGRLASSSVEPAALAESVRELARPHVKDPQVRRLAVTLERDEDEGLTVGCLWVLFGEADFEPFPRRWQPGTRATIPGLQLDRSKTYDLWVAFPGTRVEQYPVEGADGRFDIEIPLPEEPGVYRVAMTVQKKRRMPDSPFFFSLYVGTEPPAAFFSPVRDETTEIDAAATVGEWEDRLAEVLNASRKGFGLGELRLLEPARERMREIVREAPRQSFAAYRYYTRRLADDPLPEEPHGMWYPAFGNGLVPGDTTWMALEHPVSRAALLDADCTDLALGAVPAPGGRGWWVLLVPMEPAPESVGLQEQVVETLSGRRKGGLEVAPDLDAALDEIAARVAAGKLPFNRAIPEVQRLHKKTDLVSGSANFGVYAVPPGGAAPDLADFELPSGSRYVAVGDAVGDLGRGGGIQFTVLLVVVSGLAR